MTDIAARADRVRAITEADFGNVIAQFISQVDERTAMPPARCGSVEKPQHIRSGMVFMEIMPSTPGDAALRDHDPSPPAHNAG